MTVFEVRSWRLPLANSCDSRLHSLVPAVTNVRTGHTFARKFDYVPRVKTKHLVNNLIGVGPVVDYRPLCGGRASVRERP
jgi:hypothetical protein